jgi:hypothetical protein
MTNVKISDLAELAATPDNADILEIVDMAPTPTSKKITAGNLRAGLAASGANADITSLTALSGQQTIPTINLSGGQIAFPATAVPSADANTLDDYEEGTWTPVIADAASGGNTGTGSLTSYYRKIGGLVNVSFGFSNINTTGMTAGNYVYVQGLPFAPTQQKTIGICQAGNTLTLTAGCLIAYTMIASTALIMSNGGSTADHLLVSDIPSGTGDFFGTITYYAA